MSQLGARPGVLAAVGPAKIADLRAFAGAGLSLIRLRAHVNPAGDVPRWRDVGASDFLLQLLSPWPARRPTSPQAFVDAFSEVVEAYLRAGVRNLEIHDEPNRADRGAGVSWEDGRAFGDWFEAVAQALHHRFGDDVRVGFPALAGPLTLAEFAVSAAPQVTLAEDAFLEQCQSALASADWAALHVYWRSSMELRDRHGGVRFLSDYLGRFPTQDFYVTSFANLAGGAPPQVRGHHYAEFLTLVTQYDRILGAVGFPLRSADPHYRAMSWMAADGQVTPIWEQVAARPCLPDPARLSLSWPTDTRRYRQDFGNDQPAYERRYGITGGHNGVDLAVGDGGTGSSPVRAALDGTVTQVALDADGYGTHVRVRSYGPDRETISLLYAHLAGVEVSVGMLVFRGDTLGWVEAAPTDSETRLHLGMHIAGIRLPQLYDAVNPRPYLEVAPEV